MTLYLVNGLEGVERMEKGVADQDDRFKRKRLGC